jgi:predicted nucleic acid-binding protein
VSHFYLDASAVVKRYKPEPGSTWVDQVTAASAGHTIILSEITLVEVAAALAATHRAPGGITRQERDDALALFLNHCHTAYDLVAVNRDIIDRAVTLTQHHGLRGYDAMQLATAPAADKVLVAADLSPVTLIAADEDLVAAAQAEGLAAANPNHLS